MAGLCLNGSQNKKQEPLLVSAFSVPASALYAQLCLPINFTAKTKPRREISPVPQRLYKFLCVVDNKKPRCFMEWGLPRGPQTSSSSTPFQSLPWADEVINGEV